MTDRVLVTGVAGFIGSHVADRLLRDGNVVVGLDNFDGYYDPGLKRARVARLVDRHGFTLVDGDVAEADATLALVRRHGFGRVLHFAAQPGVRPGLTAPHRYVAPNVAGFLSVLEACRHGGVEHLVFASSSSVYGANRALPFSEHAPTEHPVSLYAATKKANEMMAHSYAHLFGIPTTGLRFFTVYGPWGRPDMAMSVFADRIARGLPIEVAGGGRVRRDFTYIDDVVEGVVRIAAVPPSRDPAWDAQRPDPATSDAPFRLLNVGGDRPESLNRVIALLEAALGRAAIRRDVGLPAGDVTETRADSRDFVRATGFTPQVSIEDGIARFVAWHRAYHAREGVDA